ncbi:MULTISPECIES: hypothetical protein [Nisaea]|jgi:hypothetical protein|uniref:hypothetical protein n=1 Tax=Nisaea TaxID=390876 RepID=UPI001866F28B|nr:MULTISPECIES: hypothetical protein [Nisaea]MBO6561595.1 hypothetical protein [Nisaea sp.]
MASFETTDRRALGILSDTVAEKLGPSDKVTREIRRAYTSGKQIDRFMARAAFDALPGWQRTDIGSAAEHLAHAIIREALQGEPFQTERDWRDMESPQRRVRTARKPDAGGDLQAPPRFLTRAPR